MIPMHKISRRKALRGMMNGAAVTLGLPLLDCYLNTNGTALADGAPIPIRFGTWFQGLGLNPGFWEPEKAGAGYDMREQLQQLQPLRNKTNIYSGMRVFTDGHPQVVHHTGQQVCLDGGIPPGAGLLGDATMFPSIDTLVADKIGTRNRFRSLEVSCSGTPQSLSHRSASSINPSEVSPLAMYQRIFGPEFKDPNAADFTPDPAVMVRRSALSVLGEQRQDLAKSLGTADRVRLDEYFTSLRELENQLDIQLQKPAPMASCSIPGKSEEQAPPGMIIDDVLTNNKIFAGLLAHALACDQTRVINILFTDTNSGTRRASSPMTYHIYSHEESVDPKLGYQPNVTWFMARCIDGLRDMVTALDSIKEGDGTLLDHSLLMYVADHGYAKFHSVEHMPMMTFGSAGGRIKTGIHVPLNGETVTRVGLTVQAAFGVAVGSWGTESNQTSRTISEVLA